MNAERLKYETRRERVLRIAMIRDKKCKSTDYFNRKETLTGNIMGVLGEIEFEERYGVPIDESYRPYGDGGIDFTISIKGKLVTFNVKTATTPSCLIVMEKKMKDCADICLLAKFHKHPSDENLDRAELLGWERREVIAQSAPKQFFADNPEKSYWVSRDKLLTLPELDELIAWRDE